MKCKCILGVAILSLAHLSVGRVLVDKPDDLKDYGNYLQFKGLNFSLNGLTRDGSQLDCTNRVCSPDIQLPSEVEHRINELVHNSSLLEREAKWVQSLPRAGTSNTNSDNGLEVHSRQKRFISFVVAAVVGAVVGAVACAAWCGGDAPAPTADPYAEERYLLEQERTKRETILFCYDTCVKEWSQWNSCTKPCGSGTQTRTRELTEPENCVAKWEEYEFPPFECPYTAAETKPCNEGCPNGGEPNSAGCSCASGWSGTCCNRKLHCPYPGQPANGETILTTSPSPVGSVVMYDCDPGYVLDGSRNSICQNNEQWSTDVPSCQRIVCSYPALTEPLQVLNQKDSYDFGESIHFKCDDGFVLEGPQSRTCQDSSGGQGRWSLYTPYCTAGECPAPTQADIPHGFVQGADYSYEATITFVCHDGYELIGLSTLTCTKHGRWNGFFPTCEEISCPAPYPPVNGDMQLYGTDTVVFSCQEGYQLTDENNRVATCENDGQWSIATPICQAIECDGSEIEQVENGYTNGGVYRYPFSVAFGCFPGFVLQGLEEITCQDNGEWSGDPPSCNACPLNTYMEEWSTSGVCSDCPDNSHTTTTASTNRQQCICDDGYAGPNGGPCQEVTCTLPDVPINGGRGACEVNVGDTCLFTCDPGYAPTTGARLLECLSNGHWSNEPYTCAACPIDSYNPEDEPTVCSPCGVHMTTNGLTGQVREGCMCEIGWEGQPGGPCTDLNECDILTGGLACEDECINTEGSFYCVCTIPGYELDDDGRSCIATEQCRELTAEDAPLNGALVCTYFEQHNSRFCHAKCNNGFDFAGERPNNYETCGSTTGFVWSFAQDDVAAGLDPTEARINDCIPEIFPGWRLWADIFYLSGACDELTEEEQNNVKEAFVQILMDDGVCPASDLSCTIDNVQIICGRREKRDADGNVWKSIDFNFEVKVANLTNLTSTADCDSYVCPLFRIPAQYCSNYCHTVVKHYYRGLLHQAEAKLKELSESDLSRIRFSIENQDFEPEAVNVHEQNSSCPRSGQAYVAATPGKEAHCRACQAGEFLNENGTCELCPNGTHQLLAEQMSCLPCPLGSRSEEGWAYCLTCGEGLYGENCEHQCSCVNGKCDRKTGACECSSGWEGPSCTVNKDPCQQVVCPAGTTCHDKLPPEDGFTCE